MTKARDIASAIPAPSTVSSTELGYLDGVTSAIQTQMDAKAPSSTAVTLTDTQTLTNKTLTNPVIASVVNNTLTSTTGDMIYASAANTPARLAIGSSAQVLTVASGIPSWATPSSGSMTLLSTTTLSGASTTVSSISQTYTDLKIVVHGVSVSAAGILRIAPNGTTNISTHNWYNDYGGAADSNFSFATTGYINLNSNTSNNTAGSTVNSWEISLTNYSSTAFRKQFSVSGLFDYAGGIRPAFFTGGINTTSAISSLVFSNSTGNLSTGTVLIYGVK